MTIAQDAPVSAAAPTPRYADGRGEAGWEFDWGSVLVAPTDDEDGAPLGITVDLEGRYQDDDEPLTIQSGRELAAAVLAACDAAEGKPLGWTQFHAESAPNGDPDPDKPGMWKVSPSHWVGVTRLTETFDLDAALRFGQQMQRQGRSVIYFTRTFRTLTEVSEWTPGLGSAVDVDLAPPAAAEVGR